MRRSWCVGVAAFAVGCLGPDRPGDYWADQIERTDAVPDPNSRANTLATIAESAAYAGDATAAAYALDRLGRGPQRDELAARCVGHLAARDPAAARSLARRIDDRGKRADAVAKLDTKPADNAPRPDADPAPPPTDQRRPAGGR